MYAVQYNDRYEVYKKQLSIHSEDRDITQWPNSNSFEIEAPVDYRNVVSIQLNDIEMPSTLYVFSTANQNTKLTFSVFYPRDNLPDEEVMYTITIGDGTYTPEQLAIELQNRMNEAVEGDCFPFTVMYNCVNMKMAFIHKHLPFTFIMKQEDYPGPSYYDQYMYWGLGRYLGFDKKIPSRCYIPTEKHVPLTTVYTSTTDPYKLYWMSPPYHSDPTLQAHIIEAPYALSIYGDGQIYMELACCNNIDEIEPYTYRSNALYKPKQAGKHNASFAKIPILGINNARWFTSRESFLTNVYFNDPPLERIQKFRLKFRYHDGRPVDFNNINFNLTLQITMLRANPVKMPIQVGSNHFKLS
jgi:hypothetical protein